jgi:hypothetical protein
MSQKVIIVNREEKPWMEGRALWIRSGSEKPSVVYKSLIDDESICPKVQFVRYDAGHREGRHSHPTGEFLYIIAGEIDLDGTVVGEGTLIFVDKNTVYGPLIAGAEGTEFLRVEVN